VGGDDGVFENELVGVGEADGVEAHTADGAGDLGAVSDVEAAGNEELVGGAVVVYGDELEAGACGVDYVCTLCR